MQRREKSNDSSVLFSIRRRIIIEDRQGQKWIDPSLSICANLDEYFSPSCSSSALYSDEGFPPSVIFFRITKHIEKKIFFENDNERERTDKQILSYQFHFDESATMVFLRYVAFVAFALICSTVNGQTGKSCDTCDPAKCPVVSERRKTTCGF